MKMVMTVIFGSFLSLSFNARALDLQTLANQVSALQTSNAQLQNRVTALEQSNSQLQTSLNSLTTRNGQLLTALNAVKSNTVLTLNGKLGLQPDGTTALFNGVNVQIVNGLNDTNVSNHLGNLIMGYDEFVASAPPICSNGEFADQTTCLQGGATWCNNQHGALTI